MRLLLAIGCLFALVSTLAAQTENRPPEALLPAESLLYLRFDGIEPHRKAYEKTALHELLQEDLGDFLGYLTGLWTEALLEQAKNAARPAQQNALRFLSKPGALLKYAEQNGLAAGVEVLGHSPPRWQLTIVFPGAASKNRDVVVSMLRLMTALAVEGDVKESKLRGRTLTQFHWNPVNSEAFNDDAAKAKKNHGAWWIEDDHIILILGTENVDQTLDLCDGKRPNWTTASLYRNLSAFAGYETFARASIDLPKVIELIGTARPNHDKKKQLKETFARRLLIRRTGLDGLKALTMHWGFDGRAQRSTIALGMVEPKARKGLLKLFASGIEFDVKQWPSLAPDASIVSVHRVDLQALYDAGLQLARIVEFKERSDKGEETSTPTDFEDMVNKALTLDLRNELLPAFGDEIVLSKAASNGPFFLGYSVAIKIRDEKKLHAAFAKLIEPLKKYLADQGEEIKFQESVYRNVKIHTLAGRMLPVAPSSVLQDGWLTASMYPQTIRAAIWRTATKRPGWQPPADLDAFIAAQLRAGNASSKLAAVSVSDPAILLDRLLPLAPLFVRLIGLESEQKFDVTQIPHAQAITHHLFPNVTICVDDGSAVRWESRSSTPAVLLLGRGDGKRGRS